MKYTLTNELFALRLTDGEELRDCIAKACLDAHCDSVVILGALGMVSNVTLGWFTGNEYLTFTYDETFEVSSLTGEISYKKGDLYPHMHLVLNRRDHSTLAGHCLRAITSHNMEIFLKPIHTMRFEREFDGWFDALNPVLRHPKHSRDNTGSAE